MVTEQKTMLVKDLLHQLEDESKREELLEGIVGQKTLLSLAYEDVLAALDCEGYVVMCEAEAEYLQIGIRQIMNPPLSVLPHYDFYEAKKIILSVTINELEMVTMEEMNHLNEFMSEFDNSVEVRFGITVNKKQKPRFKIVVWGIGFEIQESTYERISIKLDMCDEEFIVRVQKSEIEKYKALARFINERYDAYANAYKDKSKESLLIMTLFDVAKKPFVNY